MHGSGAPLESRAASPSGFAAAAVVERGVARGLRGVRARARLCATRPRRPPRAGRVSYDLQPARAGALRHRASRMFRCALTEVLVFHQPGRARGRARTQTVSGRTQVVSFLGRAPTDHLLCFDHDRLKRIEASVALPAAEAPALFAAACADWRRGDPRRRAPGPDACEGRQGDIAFSARRTEGPEAAAATVSITLEAVSP